MAIASVRAQTSVLQKELRPKHVTPETLTAVKKGLDYLAARQSADGGWQSAEDGSAYPLAMTALAGMAFLANGNTPNRGPYADQVSRAERYVMKQTSDSGLLVGPGGGNGRPMYGHGFSLLFLSCVYGMETEADLRLRLREVIDGAIRLHGNPYA